MGRPSSLQMIQKHNTFGFSGPEIEATLSFKYGKLLPREFKKKKKRKSFNLLLFYLFIIIPLPSGFFRIERKYSHGLAHHMYEH